MRQVSSNTMIPDMRQSQARLHFSAFLAASLILSCIGAAAAPPQLPDLGPPAGSVSPQEAYQLGRSWLRVFRARATLSDDPLLHDYLHHLTYRLAEHSRLDDHRLEIVVVDNPQINAFAVPGGVIGVHNGLLLHTRSEAELAAVLGHELAHLQQKHFERRLEQARRRTLPTLAGLLAGVLLAATSNGEAALAALYSTQAAVIEALLRYSREHELEADRFGMAILAAAGIEADAVPGMFERLQAEFRYRSQPPEFLLTHPVTERRIAESRSLARQYRTQGPAPDSGREHWDADYFYLMKARVQVALAAGPAVLEQMQQIVQEGSRSPADHYGYALALAAAGRLKEAQAALEPLLAVQRPQIPFVVTAASIAAEDKRHKEALALLTKHRQLQPDNYPLDVTAAQIMTDAGNPAGAARILRKQLAAQRENPFLWLLLSEAYGLAGDLIGVHMASAEHLVLHNRLPEARRQLSYALKLVKGDPQRALQIQQRLQEIKGMQQELQR